MYESVGKNSEQKPRTVRGRIYSIVRVVKANHAFEIASPMMDTGSLESKSFRLHGLGLTIL